MVEKMKDSGISWIGEVPESWEVKRVRHVIEQSLDGIRVGPFGSSLKEAVLNTDDGEYKIYGQANLIRHDFTFGENFVAEKDFIRLKNYEVKSGDVLLSMMGTIGKCSVVPDEIKPGIMDSHLIKIRLAKSVFGKYFEYVYEHSGVVYAQLIVNSNGSTMNGLNSSIVKNVYVPFPPENEQRAIASFLDWHCARIDGIIADLERQIDLLKRYKKSLITETVTKGLDKNAPMEDSGVEWIGEIPKSWKLSRVKYLMDDEHPYPIGDGDHGLIKAEDYLQEGIPYIRVLNLTWGMGLNMENIVYIPESLNNVIKNSELKPGDLLIAKTGATIGKTAIVPEWMPVSNTTSHVGKITMPKSQCAKYFYYVLTSDIVQKQIEDLSAMQSTRPELGIEGLKNLVLTVPTLDEQHKIANFLDSKCEDVDSLLGTKEIQLDKMKNYKQSLIYEYVTGKKRVKEVRPCPSEQTS